MKGVARVRLCSQIVNVSGLAEVCGELAKSRRQLRLIRRSDSLAVVRDDCYQADSLDKLEGSFSRTRPLVPSRLVDITPQQASPLPYGPTEADR